MNPLVPFLYLNKMDLIIEFPILPAKKEHLKNRMLHFVSECQIPEQDGQDLWHFIETQHENQSRKYHNLSHIYSLLKLKDQFLTPINDPEVLEWSIWFHDVIYRSTRKDNEKKSAEEAKKWLSPYLESPKIKKINTFILSTAKHQPQIEDSDLHFFLDFDLAILAAEKSVYQKYVKAIREEYKVFPNMIYRPGRKKVLSHFLKREYIYFTKLCRNSWEENARQNLQWELENL